MDGRRSVLPEASVSLVEALFDAPVAALWLAAKILSLKVRVPSVVSRAKTTLL